MSNIRSFNICIRLYFDFWKVSKSAKVVENSKCFLFLELGLNLFSGVWILLVAMCKTSISKFWEWRRFLLFHKCINICDKYMEIVWVHFQMICMLHMCCDQEFAENWLNILGGFKAPLSFCLLLQISCWQDSIILVLWKEKKAATRYVKPVASKELFIHVIATQVRHPGYMNWHKCLWVTTKAAFEFLNFFRKPK